MIPIPITAIDPPRASLVAMAWGAGGTGLSAGSNVISLTDGQVDPRSMWSAGNPTRLTVPVAGTYRIGLSFQATGVTGNFYGIARKNGTTAVVTSVTGSGGNYGTSASTTAVLAAGDYLELVLEAADDGTVTSAGAQPILWLYKVGLSTPGASVSTTAPVDATDGADLLFDMEVADTGDFWSVSNPARLTASRAGYYYVTGSWSSADTQICGGATLNHGSSSFNPVRNWINTASGTRTFPIHGLFYMEAGDYITTRIDPSGGTGTITVNAGASLSIQRVG